MSWRRFRVLLAGLGPNSALVAKLSARQRPGRGKGNYDRATDVVIDADRHPEAFDEFWRSLIPKPKQKVLPA